MCVCVCVCACVRVHGSLHSMNESVTLLNLTEFTYNFNTWLIVMFCIYLLMHHLYVWKFGMSPKQIYVYI